MSDSARKEPTAGATQEADLLSKVSSSGDSTSSLVSPIYQDTFDAESAGDKEAPSTGFEDLPLKDREKTYWHNSVLTPWEEWLLNKERKERIRLQNKFMEEAKKQQDQIKEKQLQEMKKKLAEEKHKEWLQKKNELEKKEKLKYTKELKKRKTKELQKAQLEERGKEKYKEWLKKKQAEEREKKQKQQEEEEKHLAELQVKKERSRRVFEEWLQNCKNKPRSVLSSYAGANGKLSGYYDTSCYPSPSFFNPVPWKPIQAPPPSRDLAFLMKKTNLSKMNDPMYAFPFKTKENSVPRIKRT
uniref:Coiled-coil domain-containing protein 34 n=1 Tax=Geotrypetes seraphini TaxID=260995 RepID=A0A6P8PS47_GEOSA|nr:coiled-coil domain-containing protein 34 [Geotrypetes seraphini]